jgi:hypothetical protein
LEAGFHTLTVLVRCWSGPITDKEVMSIRHLYLGLGMAGLTSLVTGPLWTPACAADTLPAFTMATPAAPNPPIALS